MTYLLYSNIWIFLWLNCDFAILVILIQWIRKFFLLIDYQEFLGTHCRERHYWFQIKKCNDRRCCVARMYENEFPWLPDPLVSNDPAHYKPFDDVINTETSEVDRPSSQTQTTKAVAEEIQVCKIKFSSCQIFMWFFLAPFIMFMCG